MLLPAPSLLSYPLSSYLLPSHVTREPKLDGMDTGALPRGYRRVAYCLVPIDEVPGSNRILVLLRLLNQSFSSSRGISSNSSPSPSDSV